MYSNKRIQIYIHKPKNNNVMKKSKKITRKELIKMLENWNHGTQPVSVQYVTNPKIKKEGKNQFGEITKIASVGGLLGYSFENSVNNQLEREEKERNFLAQQLWNGKGKRINKCLSTHKEKGKFYMTLKHQQSFKSFYFNDNLKLVPVALIKPYFYSSKPKNQGVNEGNEIKHREISIENILRLKMKKTTFVIVD